MRRDTEAFADILSHAIRQRDLPLDRIAQRLASLGSPVSVAALSYWKTGRSIPTRTQSLQALLHLERILDVQPGHLTHALPGRGTNSQPRTAVSPDAGFISKVLKPLGLDLLPRFSHITHHESLRVGDDSAERTVHQLLRCEVGEVRRIPVVVRNDAPWSDDPQLEALTGCRIGQTIVLPRRGLLIAEMILLQVPAPGDHLVCSYRLRTPATPRPRHLGCTLLAPTKHLALDVTLPEPPNRIVYTWRESHRHGPVVTKELEPAPFVQQVAGDAAVGHHRLEWT